MKHDFPALSTTPCVYNSTAQLRILPEDIKHVFANPRTTPSVYNCTVQLRILTEEIKHTLPTL